MRKPSRFPRLGGAAESSVRLLADPVSPATARQELPPGPAFELLFAIADIAKQAVDAADLCIVETDLFTPPPFCLDPPPCAFTNTDGWMSFGDIRNDDALSYDIVINPDTFDLPCDGFFLPPPLETSFISDVPNLALVLDGWPDELSASGTQCPFNREAELRPDKDVDGWKRSR